MGEYHSDSYVDLPPQQRPHSTATVTPNAPTARHFKGQANIVRKAEYQLSSSPPQISTRSNSSSHSCAVGVPTHTSLRASLQVPSPLIVGSFRFSYRNTHRSHEDPQAQTHSPSRRMDRCSCSVSRRISIARDNSPTHYVVQLDGAGRIRT